MVGDRVGSRALVLGQLPQSGQLRNVVGGTRHRKMVQGVLLYRYIAIAYVAIIYELNYMYNGHYVICNGYIVIIFTIT